MILQAIFFYMLILCAPTPFIVLFFLQSLLICASPRHGGVAEWSCSGLQLRVRRFDSDLRLQSCKARVVKSVDTGDLKSPALKGVPVRVWPRAPF